MRFTSRLSILLRESILDIYQDTLPLNIWNKEKPFYRLKPEVYKLIWERILSFMPKDKLKRAAVVGSIASHLYNPKTDVDVHLITDLIPETPDFKRYQKLSEVASHVPIEGTQHPVNFYIHEVDDDFEKSESIYDLFQNKWEKYTPLREIDIKDYYETFKKVVSQIDIKRAELYRDLIDYAELRGALKSASIGDVDNLMHDLNEKIGEINKSIDVMISQYKSVKAARSRAYMHAFDSGDFGSALEMSAEADANVIYKLLERYSYADLLRKLKRYKDEVGDITPKNVKGVANIVKKSLVKSIDDRLSKFSGQASEDS
jgi:hypothetical protein